MGSSQLANRLNAYLHAADARAKREPVDERPGCTFGALTRQSVDDLGDVIERIEEKVNALLGGLALAVILELLRTVLR